MTVATLIQTASALPNAASVLERSISTLENEIRTLENSSIALEQLLPWFTGLVVVGVLIEFWVISRDYRDAASAWKRAEICPPERPSFRKLLVEGLSVLLIAGGIVGEGWIGIRITTVNGSLRSKNAELRSASDELLALVTRQAGDAGTSAQKAEDAAAHAQASLTTVQNGVSHVAKEADSIESIISARRVQDVDDLTSDLRNGFKQERVIFKSYIGDEEAFWLCVQLVSIAEKAEMDAQGECATEVVKGIPVTNLLITAPSIDEAFRFSMPFKRPGRVPGYGVGLREGPILTVLIGARPSIPMWPPQKPEAPANKTMNHTTKK